MERHFGERKQQIFFFVCEYSEKDFDSMGRNVSRGAFPAEWLDEAIWVDFENAKLPIPKEYDKYLKYLYGDYMEMIPVSERHVSHDIKQIDLGEYAGYVCKDSFAKLEK